MAFVALDAILDWPVTLYDGSWSQWGQLSGSAANGGTLRSDSIWRTDTPARSSLYIYNFATDAGPTFYTSATATPNLNDMTASGLFTGTTNSTYRVQIDDDTSSPNTFKWNSTGSATSWEGIGVPITGGAQPLSGGMLVTFASTTGHTLNDRWQFITKRPVELLSLNGGSCSSRFDITYPQLLTSITLDPAGCMPTPPESQTASANQIEEEDAGYMAGGGTGGGGGGPIAPGY